MPPARKSALTVRNTEDDDLIVWFVGYQEGEIVWAGQKVLAVDPDCVLLKSAKVWPFFRKVPYALEQLREGVIHSDDLTMATTLTKAIELRMSLAKRKKDRADKIYNAILLLNRALTEKDEATLRASMATE